MEFQRYFLLLIILFSIECKHPILYEISTRPWLYELSKKYGKSIKKLTDIPLEEFDYLQENGIEIVWMMGVWKLGSYGLEFDKTMDYSSVLPNWKEDDVIGSPYAITEYTCNPDIGTDDDLIWLREELNSRNMKLMLDFVPNHSAIDAPTASKSSLYIRAPVGEKNPNKYTEDGIAFGRYNFEAEPWKDVIQWNYWEKETRELMKDNLMTVLSFADGARCDVASLMLNDAFEQTWKKELSYWGYERPETEFWEYAFKEAKKKYPKAILMAEVYGDSEIESLYKLGFTYTYDKELLDKLMGSSSDVRHYISQKTEKYWNHSAHFVENHDENRVVYNMKGNIEKSKAAGTIAATLGGLIFINHGQWSGYKNKLEIHLRRGAYEMEDLGVKKYYKRLMEIIQNSAFKSSNVYYIDDISGEKRKDFVGYIREEEDEHYLIVVNYSETAGCAQVPIYNIEGKGQIGLHEVIDDVGYIRYADNIKEDGLTVCLQPWQTQIFQYNIKS